MKNEQPQRKRIVTRRKRQKRSWKQHHKINNPQQTIYYKLFKPKILMSHMVTIEGNMTNLCNKGTQVTIGDSGTLTGTKRGDWHGYQKHDKRIHPLTLSYTYAIPGLYAKFSSATRAPHKSIQVTLEGEALILSIIQPEFVLKRRWQKLATKDFY